MKVAVKYSVLFGEGLRVLRTTSGYDQGTLAKILGVTGPTVSRWETGEVSPKVEQVAQIGAVLGFSPSSIHRDVEAAIEGLKKRGVEVILDPDLIGRDYCLLSGKALREVLEKDYCLLSGKALREVLEI